MTTLYRSLGAASALRRQVTATMGRSCGATTTTHTATRRTYATTVAVHEKAADDVAKPKPLGTPYANLTIGIPKETFPLERRVAATPESVARLVKPGFSVVLETDAGLASNYANADYEAAGATMVPNVWEAADIVIKVRLLWNCSSRAIPTIDMCLCWWVIGTKERKTRTCLSLLAPFCLFASVTDSFLRRLIDRPCVYSSVRRRPTKSRHSAARRSFPCCGQSKTRPW
jgi:hypothetical protein